MEFIRLEFLEQCVVLKAGDKSLVKALSSIYQPFVRSDVSAALASSSATIEIVEKDAKLVRFVGQRNAISRCNTFAQLLYAIDKAITVELQHRRPDLFFVHAAAVASGPLAILLVGEPGAGKSTLCWSMCDAGYGYLSDELAPVILEEAKVEPYPRAISLKCLADDSPDLPADTVDAGPTMHIPVNTLQGGYETASRQIGAIVFLFPNARYESANLSELSASEGAARLYANALNQLAHQHDGLEAAAKVATNVRCFALNRTKLPAMVASMTALAEQVRAGLTSLS